MNDKYIFFTIKQKYYALKPRYDHEQHVQQSKALNTF